jgi:hypothetical protein
VVAVALSLMMMTTMRREPALRNHCEMVAPTTSQPRATMNDSALHINVIVYYLQINSCAIHYIVLFTRGLVDDDTVLSKQTIS